MRARTRAIIGLLALAAALPVGCQPLGQPKETGEAALRRFASAEELRSFIIETVRLQRRTFGGGIIPLLGDAGGMEMMTADSPAPPAGNVFSETNVQEPGVDEGDVVKTDGQFLYVLGRDALHIVRAVPADQMAEVARFDLDGIPDALYLAGDRAVVLSVRHPPYFIMGPMMNARAGSAADEFASERTIVTIIGIADPSQPELLARLTFEADLHTSRLIGSILHLVMHHHPLLPEPIDALANVAVDDLLPDVFIETTRAAIRRNIADWPAFYHPVDPDGVGMTFVVSLDVTAPDTVLQSQAILADAGVVYASAESLYVTDTDFTPWRAMRSTTDIYRFDLTVLPVVPTAVGTVPGRVLNQFSLSEYKGHLRIATQVHGGPTAAPRTAVFVLRPSGEHLQTVGKIDNIAPGERMYAARFIGDHGFLVTFLQVDPLFTLDLSDPENPRLVGELEVPGFSTYLHPLDEDHILGIGKDALPDGDFAWFRGVQISVFDLSDFSKPTLEARRVIGDRGTDSEALYDHKAFTYFAPQQALAIPIDIMDGTMTDVRMPPGELTFSGVEVYHVAPGDPIEWLGGIETDASGMFDGSRRAVFIDDTVYAVWAGGVRAAGITNLDEVLGEVTWP